MKHQQSKKTVKKQQQQALKPLPVNTAAVVDVAKKPAEKRKECSPTHHNHQMISIVNNFNENNGRMQATLKRKKNKKSKKSASVNTLLAQSPIGPSTRPVSFNKENLQVKALLLNEYKRGGCFAACNGGQVSQARSVEALFNKKNQMRRANKSATFASTKNNLNKNQRKYHKLQQPANFSSSVSMQF